MEIDKYVNELIHGGPGSGRYPKGSSGNTPGSRAILRRENSFKKWKFEKEKINDNLYFTPKLTAEDADNSGTFHLNKNSKQKDVSKATETSNKQNSNNNNKDKDPDKITDISNKKELSKMTDKELKEYNQRQEEERKYKQNNPEPKSKLEVAKDVTTETGKAVNEANRLIDKIPSKREKMDLSSMSNKELNDMIERYKLETRYNELFAEPSKTEKGKETAKNILATVGALTSVTGSVLGIILAIKQLKD